ncbi:MAG TPA: VOC family protein [Candidatus Binatus sp.]|nr:VOC family protein [Candidatus Binatus sp.]
MFGPKAAFSGFSVDNLDKARRFYRDTLGLAVSDDGPGFRIGLPGEGSVFAYPKPDHQPASFTILNFVVDDIGSAVDDLRERGVNFKRYAGLEVDDKGIFRGGGPLIAWFTDPAGNVLSVLERS